MRHNVRLEPVALALTAALTLATVACSDDAGSPGDDMGVVSDGSSDAGEADAVASDDAGARFATRMVGTDSVELLDDFEQNLVWVNDVRGCIAGVTDQTSTGCDTLASQSFGGISTWRMPTSAEMSSLITGVVADDVQLNYINASCAVMTTSDGWVFTENSNSPGTISQIEPGNAGLRCVARL